MPRVLPVSVLLATALVLAPVAHAAPKKSKSGKSAKVEVQADAKGKKDKKSKNPRAAELDAERSSGKGLKKWRPERHMLDLGAFGGVMIPAKDHGLFDSGQGARPTLAPGADLGLRLEYYPLAFLGAGLEGAGMPTRSPSLAASTTAYAFRGHVIGQLPYRFTPMLLLGGGLIGNKSATAILNSGRGAFHWGGGLKFHVNKWIAVRLDGRHVVAGSGSSRFSVGEVTLGLDITLRLRDWIKPRAPKDGDGDGDGVPDSKDACPATEGTDGHGCPPHLRDLDEDGIMDNKDGCPREWADTPGGCPVSDKDGDGIPDERDSCIDEPENQNGWKDSDGCPDEVPADVAAFSGVIRGITFETGSDKIRKSSYKVIDKAVTTLSTYPEMRIEVVGHTDDQGEMEANLELSQSRADAVRAYMVDKGVDAGRIYTRGAGQAEPIADNKSKKGRAKNRRIEFRLISQ